MILLRKWVELMYNSELKNRYLNAGKYSEFTLTNYRYILRKAEKTELALDKDIHNMNVDELHNLLHSYGFKTKESANIGVTTIRRYIDFCIEQGYVPSRINFLDAIGGSDLERFVDVSAKEQRIISYDDLLEVEELRCENAQDAVIPELIFMGLKGEALSELINLKVTDVKPDRIILPNREISIDLRTYKIIQDAIDETAYQRSNGEPSESSRFNEYIINPTEYVIRVAGSTKGGKINYQSLMMRLSRLKEYFGNDYLNATVLHYSGMVHKAKQIIQDKGTITKEDYADIGKIYDYEDWYIVKNKVELYL
jgi:hypothetical protein